MRSMSAEMKTTQEIEGAIEAMTLAYRSRKVDDLLACFAPDSDAVLYGTGGDEKRIGPEQIRAQVERDWGQTESAEMAFSWKSIGAAGNVAWAALDGAFNLTAGGQALSLPARVSLVFEKRDGQWLIVHSHFSTPAAAQEEGHSF
jgi:ketosteroid isomerase-like protein